MNPKLGWCSCEVLKLEYFSWLYRHRKMEQVCFQCVFSLIWSLMTYALQSVEGEHHEKAVELLKAAQGKVKLVVRYTPKVLEEMESRFEKMRSAKRRQQNWCWTQWLQEVTRPSRCVVWSVQCQGYTSYCHFHRTVEWVRLQRTLGDYVALLRGWSARAGCLGLWQVGSWAISKDGSSTESLGSLF